jgi:hypothetical protein
MGPSTDAPAFSGQWAGQLSLRPLHQRFPTTLCLNAPRPYGSEWK